MNTGNRDKAMPACDAAGILVPAAHAGSRIERHIMSNATVRRLITRALVSAVIFVAQTSAFTQVKSGVPQPERLGQFCAPPDENQTPRLYCWDWQGGGDIAVRGLRTPT